MYNQTCPGEDGYWLAPAERPRTSSRWGRISKRMQRDAIGVSIVRSGRKTGSFAECQQLIEGAPLMRMPLGASGT